MNNFKHFNLIDHDTAITSVARGPKRSGGPRAVLLCNSFTKHLHILYLLA